ncbi:hypothetical protein CEW87_09010 [Parazoarcus communis]|uniref:Uncharacterized protein n=2 Tax=Parazoarcus communis TaxID=41977 RepID=A0A2U8H2U4_9RHOO|nr:hypothetical protein CEW87_09010 [Parazoarcus communis]
MTSDLRAPATFHYIAFYDLLADAAFQHRCATAESDSFRMNRYARASVIAAALSVECAANCLIHSLELSATLRTELDKLSPLAKVETYLQLSEFGALDRGRVEVQRMKELITARNEYVHPKVAAIGAVVEEPKDAGHEWHVPFSIDGEHWSGLQIPKKAMFWSNANSQTTLRAIAEFFRYLFVELMKSTSEQLHGILPSRIQIGDVHMLAVFEEFKREIAGASEFGADFSYLGLTE